MGTCIYTIKEVNNKFKSGLWTIYKEKEFEILEYSTKSGSCRAKYAAHLPAGHDYIISKVRRLSDNQVFQLGDKVQSKYAGNSTIITKFIVDDNTIQVWGVWIMGMEAYVNLDDAILLKQPLFLDELGNEVFEGDTYYFIFNLGGELYLRKIHSASITSGKTSTDKYFKYEKDAERYFDDNKPMYSKKQVLEALDWGKHEYYKSIANDNGILY